MIVTARDFTSEAEMRAAKVAVHSRVCKYDKAKVAPPVAAKILTIAARKLPPEWRFQETLFDAHVVQYRARLVNIGANPARVHIKDRCRELGVPYRVIIGDDRRDKTVAIRHLLMWEVHQRFALSFPAIGRLFGGRDHTTALYAIRKIEAQRGEA